ncbi:MAG TPA: DNA repair exonuclease [Clostridia bacterium]|nr:DNA repair exonuclease [Clostridia bacterium]
MHLADVHLDTPFVSRDEALRRRLQESVREAFGRAVDLALENRAHALLIAGDLFDNNRLTFNTEKFLVEQLSRLNEAGIKVYYATGNHDPGRGNYRAHRIPWPPNVYLFTDAFPRTYAVTDRDGEVVGYVTGAGHATPAESANIAAMFPPEPSCVEDNGSRAGSQRGSCYACHVGLLHTWVETARGGETHDRYAPCTPLDLAKKGYRYWALGHIHGRQQVLDEPQAHYPGNIQGRSPRETGPKGALLIEVDESGVLRAEFCPLSPVIWGTMTLEDLTRVDSLFSLHDVIMMEFDRLLSGYRIATSPRAASPDAEWILRIILKGRCPIYRDLSDEDNLEALREEVADLTGALHVEIKVESLYRAVRWEDYAEGPHVLASLVSLMEQAKRDDDLLDRIASEYLSASGIAGLEPKATAEERRRYLRELLDGLEDEAVARMVVDDAS